MVILDKKLSSELSVLATLENGKVALKLVYAGKLGGGSLVLDVSADTLIDKLKDIVPGKIDDYIIDALKAAFLK